VTKHNAANERIKREYFQYLVEAKGRDEATIDGVAKSLARFEEQTRAKDFKRFHREQAVAFKAKLALALNARTGERTSKATMLSTLRDLRAFFFWLAHLPGFKSHIGTTILNAENAGKPFKRRSPQRVWNATIDRACRTRLGKTALLQNATRYRFKTKSEIVLA
jgi:hypothetical protein